MDEPDQAAAPGGAEPAPDPDETAQESAEESDDGDDVRRKFREALQRKQGGKGRTVGDGTGKKSKGVSEANGPAARRREYGRRKSG